MFGDGPIDGPVRCRACAARAVSGSALRSLSGTSDGGGGEGGTGVSRGRMGGGDGGGGEGWRGGRGARACLFSFRARTGARLTSRLRAPVQVPQHRSRGEECDAVERGGRNPLALEHQLSLEVLERAMGRPAPALLGHWSDLSLPRLGSPALRSAALTASRAADARDRAPSDLDARNARLPRVPTASRRSPRAPCSVLVSSKKPGSTGTLPIRARSV